MSDYPPGLSWKRIFLIILAALLLLALTVGIIFRQDIAELKAVFQYANLFKPDHLAENFKTFYQIYPHSEVPASGDVFEISRETKPLPSSCVYRGEEMTLDQWIKQTDTTGLLVIHQGSLLFEEYYQGYDEDTLCLSMSVAKSFVSYLLGIALERGDISSLEDSVDLYVPELKESGYAGVSIKDVLQMASGIGFNEDYDDLQSDFVKMVAAFTSGSISDFLLTLDNEKTPGTYNEYVSANSQVLGSVLVNATGKSLTQLTEEQLWSRLGVEHKGIWLNDTRGMELAFGGYYATLRDYARFGLLYLEGGVNYRGERLISQEWVEDSVTPDEPHLEPGAGNPGSAESFGYGYHWWLPEFYRGDYLALGIYGQFIYVDPLTETVIVKTSAYKNYDIDGLEMEKETVKVFQAIASSLP